MQPAFALTVVHIEDNRPDALITEKHLRMGWKGECHFHHFSYLREGLEFLGRSRPDVILLDLSLPDVVGLDGLRKVSETCPDVPIVMATGNADDSLAIEALQHGAQDYIVKGRFTADSLVKTIRYAIERNRVLTRARGQSGSEVRIGELSLDTESLRAKLMLDQGIRELDLTPIEFKMLLFMARNFNKDLSRQDLVKSVWGDGVHIVDRTVDTHVSHLRAKLQPASIEIRSIRGVGYRMQDARGTLDRR